jgi:hypothetical protein
LNVLCDSHSDTLKYEKCKHFCDLEILTCKSEVRLERH